jgi:hypothetical protein
VVTLLPRYKKPIIKSICSWPKFRRHFVHKQQDSLFTDWTITWPEFTALTSHYNYPATMDSCTWPHPLSLQHYKFLRLDLNVSPQQTVGLNQVSRCFIPITKYSTIYPVCKNLVLPKIKFILHQIYTTSSTHVSYMCTECP